MNQEQVNNKYVQDSDEWKRIGNILRSIRSRVDLFLPLVKNQAPAKDLYYHLGKAVDCWVEVGGLKQPEPQLQPIAEESQPEGQKGKRGPKQDGFLLPDVDRKSFILTLRKLIEKRYIAKGKYGMMVVGREKLNEIEPSKYFACLYSVLIEFGKAEKDATPKGFERLIKEAVADSSLSQTFKLHYTSYNNMINGWMKLCNKEVIDTLKGRQRLLIYDIEPEECNGSKARMIRLEWVGLCSFVEDNARNDGLLPPISPV